MTTAIIIVVSLFIGFLIGERRAILQANAIFDENTKLLLGAMVEDPEIIAADDEPARPTVH